ncbi:MAG: iron chelate uptake ABC transporter family permease subunit, partial [Beijerinckiaceae bacterium]
MPLTPQEIWGALLGRDEAAGIIVGEIRLPRTLLAMSVGFVLGLCGAATQALTGNPLAEPAIFGTPQAAALGAVAVLYTGTASALSFILPAAAITAALCSLIVIFWLISRDNNIVSLLLVGLGIGAMASATTSLV